MKTNLQLIVAICLLASWYAFGEKTQAEKEALKKRLTEIQYSVTQEDGTEPPFKNEYWNNEAAGIYVDIVSGKALFSSLDKFKSGTGWPSFTKPIKKGIITYKEDKSLFYTRTEVRSTEADSHLGHVFDDGPKPTGKRYCINSAALKFIPAENLEKEGYGEYAKAFSSDSSQAKKANFAIFAGGCFWCTEADFEKLPGVLSAESGYIDGNTKKPTYKDVSRGITGHTEAVKVTYDPKLTNYATLLDHFWPSIDPTVKNRQFCDNGSQYRTGIYYLNNDQKKAALASSKKVNQLLGRTIHTEIKQASTFYPAEAYHQDYYKENPTRYKVYRYRCGRDARLKEVWGERAGKHLGLN